jgi:hypothetical protein
MAAFWAITAVEKSAALIALMVKIWRVLNIGEGFKYW